MCAESHQLCPLLCDPMDCSPPGSPVPWDSPSKNARVGCHALLQGIFLTQGSNPRLLCLTCIGKWFLYNQRHLGSPLIGGMIVLCNALTYYHRLWEFILYLLIGIPATIQCLISSNLIISWIFFLLLKTQALTSETKFSKKKKKNPRMNYSLQKMLYFHCFG